jgi:predicted Zn-ribbon and HTH transcriptional regulator
MKKFKCRMKGCGYEWITRVEKPKACPKCKQYLKREK